MCMIKKNVIRVTWSWTPFPLSQTVTPSYNEPPTPRAWRTLWTAPKAPATVWPLWELDYSLSPILRWWVTHRGWNYSWPIHRSVALSSFMFIMAIRAKTKQWASEWLSLISCKSPFGPDFINQILVLVVYLFMRFTAHGNCVSHS